MERLEIDMKFCRMMGKFSCSLFDGDGGVDEVIRMMLCLEVDTHVWVAMLVKTHRHMLYNDEEMLQQRAGMNLLSKVKKSSHLLAFLMTKQAI